MRNGAVHPFPGREGGRGGVRDNEHVLVAELEKAVEQYLVLYSTAQGTE